MILKGEMFSVNPQDLFQQKPDIIHGQNLLDVFSFARLKQSLQSKVPIVLQDHASSYKPKHQFLKPWFKQIDGFLFNSPGLETNWVKSGLMKDDSVYFVPEGSSHFSLSDSTTTKENDACLWVGNLDENKDPLTIIEGFSAAVGNRTDITLNMVYRSAPLLDAVRKLISDRGMQNQITLVGPLPHHELQKYYESSKYFLLGSEKEGSGYSVIEAMSCGLVPVLSNIPTFIDFCQNGKLGAIFERGSAIDFATKFSAILEINHAAEQNKVLDSYFVRWSPTALANRLTSTYQTIIHKYNG